MKTISAAILLLFLLTTDTTFLQAQSTSRNYSFKPQVRQGQPLSDAEYLTAYQQRVALAQASVEVWMEDPHAYDPAVLKREKEVLKLDLWEVRRALKELKAQRMDRRVANMWMGQLNADLMSFRVQLLYPDIHTTR